MMLPLLLIAAAQSPDTYVWQPKNELAPGLLGMNDWLHQPAGKFGFVRESGRQLKFSNGKPAVFWGTNRSNMGCAPLRPDSEFLAARLAKYGINAVRHHKFTYYGETSGIGSARNSTQLDPALLDRFDYFHHQLAARGIYSAWSPIFGHHIRPGDRPRLLAPDELDVAHSGHLKGSTYGLVNFAPDLQQLSIELVVNLLNHSNPHTGKRYADDPALIAVEMQNEDDIFFAATHEAVMKAPTYKALLCQQFTTWLLRRYGSEAGILRAWGPRALNAYPEFQRGERIALGNLYPIPHHWFHGPDGLKNAEERGAKKRMLDASRFLYETQANFYRKFRAAIRATGYKGTIVGSCWQAGDGIPHYYNLRADAETGIIDRHNYFGGDSWRVEPGPVDDSAMVDTAGSGLLSTGLQQVVNKPFAFSEWISVLPNRYGAESPALVAAYGMGLQGWDASYSFALDELRFMDKLQNHGVWVVNSPVHLGMYPLYSRSVLRGDIKEAPTVQRDVITDQELATGNFADLDRVVQSGDVKELVSNRRQLIGYGRVEVGWRGTPVKRPVGLSERKLKSVTDQLEWITPGKHQGYFTVNTESTKAVVGFSGSQLHRLGTTTVLLHQPFSVFWMTSADSKPIARGDRALIGLVSHVENTGMQFQADGKALLNVGTSPLRMRSVRATLNLGEPATLQPLDQDGFPTGLPRQSARGEFILDTGLTESPYFSVTFDRRASKRK
ncbi:MAG: hypothetical protein SFX74_10140 [Fimbriimonadaceae bacterium]|nr:hypothetical protein [Fimbriimonadaceae bacterium]